MSFSAFLLSHSRRKLRCTPVILRHFSSLLQPGFEGYSKRSAGDFPLRNRLPICANIFCFSKRIHVDSSGVHKTHYEAGRFHVERKERSRKFYHFRPLLVIYRAAYIMTEVAILTVWHVFLKDIRKRAEKLRRCLIRLGPFYVKLGQALSTRPDVLPNAYCQELAKLQDQIPPFRSSIALKFIESELGYPASELFADISAEPVAAASLGQVYKAHLISGEPVAVKVQRPGMQSRLTLDSYLLHIVGGSLRRFLGARGDVVAAVNEMVGHMFDEIDYRKEGQNAERFARLYGEHAEGSPQQIYNNKTTRENSQQKTGQPFGFVKVPKIYWNLSTQGVLTMEWIDGIKLTDLETLQKMHFDVQQLVDQGVFCSLRQLLEEGFFHADPHPGNLVVTREGKLAYFDFGMMGDFPEEYRIGLIRTLVHFVNRDSVGLANDFSDLGFVPEGANLKDIAGALRTSFGDETSRTQLDFQGIMNQLSDVMYRFNFSLPPQYALVIRALGSLEGTATVLDPQFKVVASAYPFIIGRLLADPDPQMRKILRELLIRNNGSIRWNRLERLIIAISQESTYSSLQSVNGDSWAGQDGLERGPARSWGFFDIRTVISATSDLFDFILSEDGYRVRVWLVKDIVEAFNILFDHAVQGNNEDHYSSVGAKRDQDARSQENKDLRSRVSMGLGAFIKAVESAPEIWMSFAIRFATRPEAQILAWEILRSLACAGYNRSLSFFWMFLSKELHEVYGKDTNSS